MREALNKNDARTTSCVTEGASICATKLELCGTFLIKDYCFFQLRISIDNGGW